MVDLNAVKAHELLQFYNKNRYAKSYEFNEISPVAHPINRGLGGTSLVVKNATSNKSYFIKALAADFNENYSFDDMVKLIKAASNKKITPNLIDHNFELGVLVFDGLSSEWDFGTVKDFRNKDVLKGAITALNKVHKTSPLRETKTVFDRINKLKLELLKMSSTSQDNILPEHYTMMDDYTAKIFELIEAWGFEKVPCKGEVNLSDFMLAAGHNIMLVDYDLASNGDAFSDLGYLANEISRDEEDLKNISYLYSGENNEHNLVGLRLYMIVNAFYLGLWGLIKQLNDPKSEIEYYKYGQNQFLRCRYNINRFELGYLLKKI